MCAKSLQSCPTLCDPMDCSPPGFSVHEILQERILEWDLPDPGIEPTSDRFFTTAAAAATKSLQSCPTLCDPIDGSPPGYPSPWDSPGKNTGVGCHFLLQCIFTTSTMIVSDRLLSPQIRKKIVNSYGMLLHIKFLWFWPNGVMETRLNILPGTITNGQDTCNSGFQDTG